MKILDAFTQEGNDYAVIEVKPFIGKAYKDTVVRVYSTGRGSLHFISLETGKKYSFDTVDEAIKLFEAKKVLDDFLSRRTSEPTISHSRV